MVITPKASTSLFEAVRYGEIQRDTADTTGYSWIHTDTAGYSRVNPGYSGYSGSAAKWLDIEQYRDTAGYQRYGEIQKRGTGEIQAEYPKNIRQGRATEIMLKVPYAPK